MFVILLFIFLVSIVFSACVKGKFAYLSNSPRTFSTSSCEAVRYRLLKSMKRLVRQSDNGCQERDYGIVNAWW